MKALMTTAALAAFLAAVPALAEDATPPPATDQPAATGTQPDAMTPAPSAETTTPAPDANAPASAETAPPTGDAAAPPAAAETTPDKTAPATAAAPAATGEKFLAKQDDNELLASKLMGATVYGPGDENLGDINDVIIAKEGGIHAVVVGVGGFLGMGEKNVAVAFNQIEPSTDADGNVKLVLHASKEELDSAPQYMTLAEINAEKAAPPAAPVATQ